jgi:hypothetical protein
MHATYHAFFHPSKLEKWLTHVKSFSISLHEVQFIGKYFWKNVFWNIFFEKISLFNYETCLNFVIMHVESRMLSNWPHKIICGVYIIDIIMLFMLIKCYQLWISISLMICGIYKIDIIVLLLLIESYQSWNFPYLWWIMFHDIIYKLLKLVVESKKRSRI